MPGLGNERADRLVHSLLVVRFDREPRIRSGRGCVLPGDADQPAVRA